jgi:hypothetical protein
MKTNLKTHSRILCACLITASLAIQVSHRMVFAAPAEDPVVIRLASLKQGGDGVAIRWTVKKGWLPDGGFNIYRMDNGVPTRLNETPLGAKRGSASAATARWKMSGKSGSLVTDYKVALTKASQPAGPGGDEAMRVFSATRHSLPSSAKPVFDAIGQQVQQLRHIPGPSLPSSVAQIQIREHPLVAPYMSKLGVTTSSSKAPPAPTKPGSNPQPPAISPIDEAQTLRFNLLAGALVHPEIASDLGLAFDDTKATAGTKCQYSLRGVDSAGKEGPDILATATVDKVGADVPLTPTGLVAYQLDEETVGLRWDRPSQQQTDTLGMASYQVYRTSGTGQPVLLSQSPIVIGDIPVAGGHLEPINFIQDTKVPVGDVSYQLVQTDMFGRQTKSEILKFKMEDWQMPAAPAGAQAELKGEDVMVAWRKSASDSGKSDGAVQYRIYREDLESSPDPKKVKRDLLTTTSVKGENLDLVLAKSFSGSRGRLTRTIEKSARPDAWLNYVDHNVPKDHRYRYVVTAAYPKNNMETTATGTTPVPVPLQVAPPPPGNLKLSVQVLSKPGGLSRVIKTNGRYVISGRNERRPIKLPASFLKVREQDTGATVTLNWDAVPGTPPVSYRVYRSSATGLFTEARAKGTSPKSTSQANAAALAPKNPTLNNPSGIKQPQLESKKPANSPNMPIGALNLTEIKARVLKMPPAALQAHHVGPQVLQYYAELTTVPDDSFVFLGEVKDKTTFVDDIPRSQAHHYVYRVIAVNRWGWPGGSPKQGVQGAQAKIRVPATVAPSAPAVISVAQDDVGNIDILFRPNLDEENVKSYEVKRRLLPLPSQIPAPSVAGAKGAARFGIRPAESAMRTYLRANPNVKPTLNPTAPEDGYEVIGTVSPKGVVDGILKFRDPKVAAHKVYSYYLVAINDDNLRARSGNQLCSSEISPSYPGPKTLTPAATCESVKLSWSVTADAKNYIVQRALKSAPTNIIQLSGIGSATTYTDYSIQPGESYSYRVLGVTDDGNVTEPVQADVNVPPK